MSQRLASEGRRKGVGRASEGRRKGVRARARNSWGRVGACGSCTGRGRARRGCFPARVRPAPSVGRQRV
eukprot:5272564-Prymnesium_polylepis.1